MNIQTVCQRALFLSTLLSCLLVYRLGVAATPLTLEQYYGYALQRSETTAIQLTQIQQAEERYKQAGAALYPTINGKFSYLWLDPYPSDTLLTPSTMSQQEFTRITASQPLFRGMREYAAMRQTQNLVAATRQDYRQAEYALYKDVVQNFYTILALQSDIANYQEEIRLNQERAKDLRARVRIGRSRESELLNQQSSISTLEATTEQLRGQLQVAREAFAFLSGLDTATDLQDTLTLPDKLDPVSAYLDGIHNRPDVMAMEQRLNAANEGIAIARGEHYPSLDLNANYYFDRPGYLDNSKWDVELALTIPLYAGGSIQSKVREAGAQRNQVELTQSQVVRTSNQEVNSYYRSVQSNLVQLQALTKSTEITRKNYQAQVHDYNLGLVSNLDVLVALTEYQQNQRTLDHTRLVAKNNYLLLLVASARMPKPVSGP